MTLRRSWARRAGVLGLGLASVGLGAAAAATFEAPSGGARVPVVASVLPTVALARTTPEPQAPATPRPATRGRAGHDPFGHTIRDGKVILGGATNRLVLFTFDDGPDRTTTPKVLDLLDREGIKAVFFLTTGRFSDDSLRQRQQAEVAREIVRRGHAVGSHTVTHRQLPALDDVTVIAEVLDAEHAFERALGQRPWLIRPPGGSRSARIDSMLASRGYTTVLWNLGAGDVQVRTADEVVETWKRVFERREREMGERGGIVLLHDIHPWSVEAFPRIVAWLRDRNCDFLERGEELYDIVDDLTFFYAPRGDSNPSVEAPPVALPPDVLAARQAKAREAAERRCRQLAAR